MSEEKKQNLFDLRNLFSNDIETKSGNETSLDSIKKKKKKKKLKQQNFSY